MSRSIFWILYFAGFIANTIYFWNETQLFIMVFIGPFILSTVLFALAFILSAKDKHGNFR